MQQSWKNTIPLKPFALDGVAVPQETDELSGDLQVPGAQKTANGEVTRSIEQSSAGDLDDTLIAHDASLPRLEDGLIGGVTGFYDSSLFRTETMKLSLSL